MIRVESVKFDSDLDNDDDLAAFESTLVNESRLVKRFLIVRWRLIRFTIFIERVSILIVNML